MSSTTTSFGAAATGAPSGLEGMDQAYQDAFNAGDLEALIAMYERDAVFVAEPGKVARGSDEIRAVLAGFMAAKPRFELKRKTVHAVHGIAAVLGEWSMEGTDAEGGTVSLGGQVIVVIRRQADGRWLLAIDDPFPFQ